MVARKKLCSKFNLQKLFSILQFRKKMKLKKERKQIENAVNFIYSNVQNVGVKTLVI